MRNVWRMLESDGLNGVSLAVGCDDLFSVFRNEHRYRTPIPNWPHGNFFETTAPNLKNCATQGETCVT